MTSFDVEVTLEDRKSAPVLKLEASGEPVWISILSDIYRLRGKKEWMVVVNLKTGEIQRLIVHTVLGNTLRDCFPDDKYVGEDLSIKNLGIRSGKNYFEFDIATIDVSPSERRQIQSQIAEKKAEKIEHGPPQNCWYRPPEFWDRDDWYHHVYLKSPQWKKIRKQIWDRDEKVCLRCGGRAHDKQTLVHHRSYSDEVMKGDDFSQLATICEGCHNFIHYDDTRKKRSDSETDRLLLERNENTDFPTPKVDLRLKWRPIPAGWERMSAIQRAAWEHEYERLRILRWLQKPKLRVGDMQKIRELLAHRFGMDDNSIDAAIAKTPRKRRSSTM
ncbi:MAG: hypothetical protein P4L10_14360 [Acidobacteriaceae bacterium]|nr:hypothetical protein [Acidobacteriaceae bacterium]